MHMWVGKLWLGLMLVPPCSRSWRLSVSSCSWSHVCACHMLAHAHAHAARSACMQHAPAVPAAPGFQSQYRIWGVCGSARPAALLLQRHEVSCPRGPDTLRS